MIRQLDPMVDLLRVEELYHHAGDYWALCRLTHNVAELAAEFFTNAPPQCDPLQSYRLGFLQHGKLAGVAELSFGFPAAGDAYLGLMIFADWARGNGFGVALLRHIETLARENGAPAIYLAVLDNNPNGRAFWQREGFRPTGTVRKHSDNGKTTTLHRMMKPL